MLGLSIAQYYLLYPKQLTSLTTLISTALSTAISPVCRSFKWKALDALQPAFNVRKRTIAPLTFAGSLSESAMRGTEDTAVSAVSMCRRPVRPPLGSSHETANQKAARLQSVQPAAMGPPADPLGRRCLRRFHEARCVLIHPRRAQGNRRPRRSVHVLCSRRSGVAGPVAWHGSGSGCDRFAIHFAFLSQVGILRGRRDGRCLSVKSAYRDDVARTQQSSSDELRPPGLDAITLTTVSFESVANLLGRRSRVNSICLVQPEKSCTRILCNPQPQARVSGAAGNRANRMNFDEVDDSRKNLIHSPAGFPQREHRKCRKGGRQSPELMRFSKSVLVIGSAKVSSQKSLTTEETEGHRGPGYWF